MSEQHSNPLFFRTKKFGAKKCSLWIPFTRGFHCAARLDTFISTYTSSIILQATSFDIMKSSFVVPLERAAPIAIKIGRLVQFVIKNIIDVSWATDYEGLQGDGCLSYCTCWRRCLLRLAILQPSTAIAIAVAIAIFCINYALLLYRWDVHDVLMAKWWGKSWFPHWWWQQGQLSW